MMASAMPHHRAAAATSNQPFMDWPAPTSPSTRSIADVDVPKAVRAGSSDVGRFALCKEARRVAAPERSGQTPMVQDLDLAVLARPMAEAEVRIRSFRRLWHGLDCPCRPLGPAKGHAIGIHAMCTRPTSPPPGYSPATRDASRTSQRAASA